jgi:tetratricopeptide (TPR) repeat protein
VTSRIEDLERIAAKSKKPLPWYGLAMEYRSAGRVDDALATFAKVHALAPDYVPAYFMRAQVHEEQGDLDGARAALRAGIEAARRVGDGHALSEMTTMLDSLPD